LGWGGRGIYYAWGERSIQCFDGGNLRERDHLQHMVIDGRMLLNWILKKCVGVVDCIYLGQYVIKWEAVGCGEFFD
jgi:hypothetical protein